MPLPAPNLDDRRFQDILDEARRRIPQYCPEWTDHNLSDPGITLLELFAWMTDLLLYRLNRVPDKNYVKFLELIGVRLDPARPATADVTFRLTAPQPDDVVIGRGTAVATVRTETREAVAFATDRDLAIRRPRLDHLLASRQGVRFHDFRPAIDNPNRGLGVFADNPQEHDGLYLGFGNDLSGHILAISLRCQVEGVGVDPKDPPLVWETWDRLEARWVPLRLELDSTGGLNKNGLVIVHTPVAAGPIDVDGTTAFWVRCRVLRARPDQRGYRDSPRVTGVEVASLGGCVPASHSFKVVGEVLGIGDGTPGQVMRLQTLPVLPRAEGETLEVEDDHGGFAPWTEVRDFGSSGPDDPHFVLDDVTGTVEFGPRIRTPQGVERQYGRVVLAGRKVRFSTYRSGGGLTGNVGAGTLTVLQSSIPSIAWVTNFAPAIGGTESEDLEHAKWRAPQVLRSQDRAVTADDFEALAQQASPAVGRARCLMPRSAQDGSVPGAVLVQLVPALTPSAGPVPAEQLHVSQRVTQEVQAYLDERRLLTCELILQAPAYIWVSVTARLRVRAQASRSRVQDDAVAALYRYIHPTTGGPDGHGWPFERPLFVAEVYALLQDVDGVDVVEEAALYQVDPSTGDRGRPTNRITPGSDGLLCSYEHRVQVI